MSIVHLLVDWGPFLVVVIAYDLSRGWADSAGFPVHFTPQIDVDKVLFFGHVPTEWLQRNLYHTNFVLGFSGGRITTAVRPTVPVQWFEVIFDLTYLSHYLASFILAGVLWVKSRARFQAYARRFTTLSLFGFLTYVVFPAAPPWMAAQQGFIDPTVGRIGGRGFAWLHLHTVRNMIDTGTKTTQPRRRRSVAACRVRDACRHHAVAERAEVVPSVPCVVSGTDGAHAGRHRRALRQRHPARRRLRVRRPLPVELHRTLVAATQGREGRDQSVIRSATAGLMRLACAAGAATAIKDAPSATAPRASRPTHGIVNGSDSPPKVDDSLNTE